MSNPQALMEKIQALTPERLGEVEDFVDFLNDKERRQQALTRFIDVSSQIHDAGIPLLSMEEIDAEVKAYRAERRALVTRGSDSTAVYDQSGS